MNTNWTIGRKLTTAFAVLLALVLTASAVGIYGTRQTGQAQDRTKDIGVALRNAAEVEALMRGLDGNGKLVMLAAMNGAADRKAEGHRAIADLEKRFDGKMADLKAAANTDAARRSVDEIRASFEAWKAIHAKVMDFSEKQDFEPALAADLGEGLAAQQRVLQQAEAYQAAITAEFEALDASADSSVRTVIFVGMIVLLAAIGIGAAVMWLVRQITRTLASTAGELRIGAEHVLAAANQVSGSSQSLSQGATEQAASLEETSASMEEMASMTRKNAENSQEAATEVAQTGALMTSANAALQDLVSTMTAIRESSGKVTKIIKTIDEIAFQTNILALNAAVEAARAGEAGMGFAVVADEVRNLAQRSAQAAKDTTSLIEESAITAEAGGQKVDAVVTSMTAITDSSARVKGLVDEVSVASRQQAQGIDQVTQAIAQMEKVTQTTAATAEESAAASEELNAQAEQSMAAVRRLEGLVGGAGGAAAGDAGEGRAAKRAAGRLATVIPMKKKAFAGRMTPAEEAIPLGDTGSFGRF
jgi:methyl-accepting chemotaxis protein